MDDGTPPLTDEEREILKTIPAKDWDLDLTATLRHVKHLRERISQLENGMKEAMNIIESVDTIDIEYKGKEARKWMRKYFPQYAEPGDW